MARQDKKKRSKEKTTRIVLSAARTSGKKPITYAQLIELTGAHDRARQKNLRLVLDDLIGSGQLDRIGRGSYVAKKASTFEGVIKMNSRGFGYFSGPGLVEEIKIGDDDCGEALNGDLVEVELLLRPGKRGSQGRVVQVVERARTRFVGTVHKNKDLEFLVPDDHKIHVDFFLHKNDKWKLKSGDKAIVEMTDWPSTAGSPFAKVIELLGKAGDHEVEMISILAEHGLPHAFPPAVEQEAENISTHIGENEIKKRKDLRHLNILTIDPFDAKDLDDAIHYRVLENGNQEVGVHIADVSYYVRPGSLIEKEAYKRATSVYLVDRVVPMLPEKLSNGVCSLTSDSDKLCFSAIFEMNDNAEVINEWFGRTIIRSKQRFSYEEAQEVLDTGKGVLSEDLLALAKISRTLKKKRLAAGSLNISSTEVKFKLDENNEPVGVVEKKMKEANYLIEDLMLLANKRVTEFVAKRKGTPRPFIFRIHDLPDPEKLRTLKVFVDKFGYNLKVGAGSAHSALNGLLADIDGKEEAHIIRQLTIRSMSKAEYSTDNIGHFGLAFEYYTHFTSPIRRYPDLMVHRGLAHYLENGKPLDQAKLSEQSKHCSQMERKAIAAERDSVKHMQAIYLSKHLGEQFPGVISGITRWGMYVELAEILCEGLVALRDMTGDRFQFDERRFRIVGTRTGEEFNLGDHVLVSVQHVDLENKKVDLKLEDQPIQD